MASFGKAGDDLVGYVCAEVYAQGKGQVVSTDDISELFAACQLILLQPLLQKLFPSLQQYGTGELERFKVIEFTLFEQDSEVLQDGGKPTGWGRSCLERFNNLICS